MRSKDTYLRRERYRRRESSPRSNSGPPLWLGFFRDLGRRTPSFENGPKSSRAPPRGRFRERYEMRNPECELDLENEDHEGFKDHRGWRDCRDPKDLEETALKSIRVEATVFDGRLDPKYFLEWIRVMD